VVALGRRLANSALHPTSRRRHEGMLFGYEDWQNDWWIKTGLERGAFGGATFCCAVTAAGLAWAESAGLRALPPTEPLSVITYWYERKTEDADLKQLLEAQPGSVAVLRFTVAGGLYAIPPKAHVDWPQRKTTTSGPFRYVLSSGIWCSCTFQGRPLSRVDNVPRFTGVCSGSSLLVQSDWWTRQKHPNKRTESLQRGEWTVSARRRPAHRRSSHTFWPRGGGHASRHDSPPSTPGIDGVSARPLTPEPEIDGPQHGGDAAGFPPGLNQSLLQFGALSPNL
jgi:hypothetical protein